MIPVSKFKNFIRDDLFNTLSYSYGDCLPFFCTLTQNGGFQIYDCKEEFCYDFDKEEKALFSGLPIQGLTVAKNIKRVQDFAGAIGEIETLLGIPQAQRTRIKLVHFEYKELFEGDNYDYVGFEVNQGSSFWFKSPIRVELFCCLFKTLIGKKCPSFGSKQQLYKFLPKDSDYFGYNFMIWALDNCKDLSDIVVGTNRWDVQFRFLYSFHTNGIVSAIANYISKLNATKYSRINNFKYGPKSENRILLSKS